MSLLFTPFELKNLTLKNRLVMAPMCQYSSIDGYANDWHLVHYGSRAVGGVGIIILEATSVSPEGRLSYGDLGIWEDDHIPGLMQLCGFISYFGTLPGIQLVHAGRKASGDLPWKSSGQLKEGPHSWQTVAPSPLPFQADDRLPEELTREEILRIVDDFESATRRAIMAGYKIIEIHGAHGYLVHQFLSPLSNKRSDEYGGSFDNRIRFLLEIVDRLSPLLERDHSLWVRLSATDWKAGGWDLQQSVALAGVLQKKGVEVIDVSTGGNVPHADIPVKPGYQVPFAAEIKQNTGITTTAVGLITEAVQAEEILREEQADLILMGRQLLREPYFPIHAATLLGEKIQWLGQYERAMKKQA